jgi:hypothetical protein
VDEVAGDLARGGATAEDPVDAESVRRALLEAWPASDQEWDLAGRVGLAESRRHLGNVVDVGVLLGDDLADENGIGLGRASLGDQVGDEHLSPQVDDGDLGVVLQPLLPREALDVEDRVDPDRVSVGADAGADDDQPAAQPRLIARLTSLGLSSGNSRSWTWTWPRSTRWLDEP